MRSFLRNIFATQPADTVNILDIDVTTRATLTLTGETLPTGYPRFISTIITHDGAITISTEIATYGQAKRHHRRQCTAWA